jgi:acyl-coenzyme A thioesterase PaaI-like protein
MDQDRGRTGGAGRGREIAGPGHRRGREVWREAPAGGFVDATLLTRPWREILRLIDAGRASRPPVAHLCGCRLTTLDERRAVVAIPPSDWFLGPKGRVDSGIFAFLADMAHFHAVLRRLAPARAAPADHRRRRRHLVVHRRRIRRVDDDARAARVTRPAAAPRACR